jgi:hypothetical protein
LDGRFNGTVTIPFLGRDLSLERLADEEIGTAFVTTGERRRWDGGLEGFGRGCIVCLLDPEYGRCSRPVEQLIHPKILWIAYATLILPFYQIHVI